MEVEESPVLHLMVDTRVHGNNNIRHCSDGDVVMGMNTGKIWKLGLIEIGIVLYGLLG